MKLLSDSIDHSTKSVPTIDSVNHPTRGVSSVDSIDHSTKSEFPTNSDDLVNESTKQWYVIYTKSRAEDLAREQLENKNIFVFLPKIREVRFRNDKLREAVQPLFPSYIFAQFTIPDEYYDVKWARGVKRIVGSGDMPTPLDDSIVVFLRDQADHEGLIQPQPQIRQGDKVRVKQGPLEGLWGTVQGEIDGKGRVKVLMDILHAGAKIELPFNYVEKYE